MPRAARLSGVLPLIIAASLLCAACAASESASTTTTTNTPPAIGSPVPTADLEPVLPAYAGEDWYLGSIPAEPVAADPALPALKLGMINQEDTPLGPYPELRAAVQAAAAWVNAELGGVDGHPIEILTCVTSFSVEQSEACAQQLVDEGVIAFVGGVDVMSEGSYSVIEEVGLISVGGIPANLVEQRSANAFFFSGGDAAALAAFMAHAAENGSGRVALAYGDGVDSFEVFARDYGVPVGESLGLQVDLVPFPLFAADFVPFISQAQEAGADAVIVLATTTACIPVMEAMAALEFDAQLYLTGACAAEETITGAGALIWDVLFNAEGPVDGAVVEASLFQDVIDTYAGEPAGGAGTVSFRGFMNLYALLLEAGFDGADSVTLAEIARAAEARPSFWGHPYTCDGDRVPGLPALCAPQQLLFRITDEGTLSSVTDWIATDELFASALE